MSGTTHGPSLLPEIRGRRSEAHSVQPQLFLRRCFQAGSGSGAGDGEGGAAGSAAGRGAGCLGSGAGWRDAGRPAGCPFTIAGVSSTAGDGGAGGGGEGAGAAPPAPNRRRSRFAQVRATQSNPGAQSTSSRQSPGARRTQAARSAVPMNSIAARLFHGRRFTGISLRQCRPRRPRRLPGGAGGCKDSPRRSHCSRLRRGRSPRKLRSVRRP